MILEDLIDIEAFTKSITPPDKGVFTLWSSTAMEISREKYRDVARLRTIYMEIPADELRPSQIVSFLEQMLQAMQSDEERKTFIRAEFFQFKKFV